MNRLPYLLFTLILIFAGCATTSTRIASVSPELVREEEKRQRQIVLTELEKQQQRLDSLIFPLIVASTELSSSKIKTYWGMRYDNSLRHEGAWRDAASAIGLSDTLTITSVVPRSPAESAGLQPGDRILSINGSRIPVSDKSAKEASKLLEMVSKGEGLLNITYIRDGKAQESSLQGIRVCKFGWVVTVEGGINAYADGENIIIPWSMMRFAEDDELRVVLSHELAHNIKGHIEARKKNVLLGALLGAIGDIAIASAGYSTAGEYTKLGMAAGAKAYSKDFEREADYVGLYILARAGLPLQNAPNLWRRFAQIDPKAIGYASTHPTTAERFVLLEQTSTEIQNKRNNGIPLLPEMKNKSK